MSVCNCCSCGRIKSVLEIHGQDKVYQFLIGLNDSFSAVRAQILLTDPLPSLHKVFSLIIQEEKQREITINSLSHNSFVFLINSIPTSISSSNVNHEPTASAFMTKFAPGPRFVK